MTRPCFLYDRILSCGNSHILTVAYWILLFSFQFSCMEAQKFSLDASNPAGLLLQIAVPNIISGNTTGTTGAGSSSAFSATPDIHSVNLRWTASTDGSKFKLYSSTTSTVTVTGSPEITGSGTGITGNTYTHTGLSGGVARYYLLEKIQTDGTKTYSDIIQAKPYYLPSDVSSLVLWLSADSGITKDASNKITSWLDQANGSNFVNATANQEPFWVANYRNQRPFVQTSNPQARFFSGPGVGITGSSYTILYVLEQAAVAATSDGILHLSGGPNTLILKIQNGQFQVNTGSGDFKSNTYATNVAHIATAQFSSTSTSLYLNGTLDKTTTNVYPASGNTTSYLGVYFGGAGFEGKIAEVLIYNQGLSTADRIKAECYLSFKYNLSVPHVCN
ncbi:hypothetical protein EHO62_14135 [Leptospira kmetyi]|nr:hypothetical protein EHO62_14135 [Leptospira kmetyi]TGK33065.1 hypothetical protein EHO66_04870 [Leptospira kmetyi]